MSFSNYPKSIDFSWLNGVTQHEQSQTRQSRQSQHTRFWQPCFGIYSKEQKYIMQSLIVLPTKLWYPIQNRLVASPHFATRNWNLIRCFEWEKIDRTEFLGSKTFASDVEVKKQLKIAYYRRQHSLCYKTTTTNV